MTSLISFIDHPLTHNVCLCEILYLKMKAEYILGTIRYVKSCKLLKCFVVVVCRGVFCSVNHFHASLHHLLTRTILFVASKVSSSNLPSCKREQAGNVSFISWRGGWFFCWLLVGYYSPPWMKSGSQSRDTDLMGYWDKWKLGGWLLSDPSKQVIPESMKSATYTSHFIWAKSKCSILIQHMLAHDFEIRCGYRLLATTIPLLSYLLEYTHCTFEDLHNAEHHVSFEVSVFVCFETITTYFIAQSNLTYFLFISTFTCLSDRSFACPSALRPYKLGNCLCVSSSLASMRIERW